MTSFIQISVPPKPLFWFRSNTVTETQIEENLGPVHPKLQAFQKAVEAALKKRTSC